MSVIIQLFPPTDGGTSYEECLAPTQSALFLIFNSQHQGANDQGIENETQRFPLSLLDSPSRIYNRYRYTLDKKSKDTTHINEYKRCNVVLYIYIYIYTFYTTGCVISKHCDCTKVVCRSVVLHGIVPVGTPHAEERDRRTSEDLPCRMHHLPRWIHRNPSRRWNIHQKLIIIMKKMMMT